MLSVEHTCAKYQQRSLGSSTVHFDCQDLFNYCLLKVFQLMIRGIYRIFHRFVHKGRMHSYGCPDNAVPHKELLHRRAQMQSSNHFRKAWMKGVISPIVYLYPSWSPFLMCSSVFFISCIINVIVWGYLHSNGRQL